VHHRNGDRKDNRLENLELWVVRKDPPGQRFDDLMSDLERRLISSVANGNLPAIMAEIRKTFVR
jgi:hypothetical protein